MLYKKHVISSFIGCAATALFLAACGNDYSIEPSAEDSIIQKMSLREKVGQMFFVRPEALDTSSKKSTRPCERSTRTTPLAA